MYSKESKKNKITNRSRVSLLARYAPIIIGLAIIITVIFFFLDRNNQDESSSSSSISPRPTSTPQVTSIISSVTSSATLSPTLSNSGTLVVPSKYVPAYEKGEEAYYQGDYESAIVAFSEAIGFNSNNSTIYTMRGNAYFNTGNIEQAIDDYNRALEISPTFYQALYNRGRAHFAIKNYDQALTDLQESADLAPDEFGYRANGNIGLIYQQMGEYNKALEAFTEAISYNTDETADIYYFRGETYSAMGNYEAAIADYQAAIERFSNYNQAYQGLGYAYFKTDRLNEAVEALNQALQISPNNPVSHLYFTLVYLALEESDQAQAQAIQAARSIDQLPQEEQSRILVSVLADLETFRENHPNRAEEVDTIITLLPAP